LAIAGGTSSTSHNKWNADVGRTLSLHLSKQDSPRANYKPLQISPPPDLRQFYLP